MYTELMKETTKINVVVQSHVSNPDLIVSPSSWTRQHSTRNREAPASSWSCPEDVIHPSKISYSAAGHLEALSWGMDEPSAGKGEEQIGELRMYTSVYFHILTEAAQWSSLRSSTRK